MRSPDEKGLRSAKAPILAVELLEERRLLSHPGSAPTQPFEHPGVAAQVDTAVPSVSPALALKDNVLAPRQGGWSGGSPGSFGFAADSMGRPGIIVRAEIWADGRGAGPGGTFVRDPRPNPSGPDFGPSLGEIIAFVLGNSSTPVSPSTSVAPSVEREQAVADPAPAFSHAGAGASVRSEEFVPPGPSSADPLTVPVTVAIPPAPSNATIGPAHGQAVVSAIPGGQGLLGGFPGRNDRRVIDGAGAKGIAAGGRSAQGSGDRSYDGVPPGLSREEGGSSRLAARPIDEGHGTDPLVNDQGMPEPQRADILTDFLPFDRSALDGAIDRLLGRFDGTELPEPTSYLPAAMALALTVLASDALLRLRQRTRDDETDASGADGEAGPRLFPGHWSLEES